MSTKKGYMVLEVGWEYNDEGYNNSGGFESPTEVYLDKETADKAYNKIVLKDAKSGWRRLT